jgi:hypothetical protein
MKKRLQSFRPGPLTRCGDVQLEDKNGVFLLSNFRRVLYVLCFLLGNSSASEYYMPTFRNTLFHLHKQVGVE